MKYIYEIAIVMIFLLWNTLTYADCKADKDYLTNEIKNTEADSEKKFRELLTNATENSTDPKKTYLELYKLLMNDKKFI